MFLFFCTAADAWSGRVAYIFEGDIIHVEPVQGGERIRVRLYGIDCPDRQQPYEAEATQFVSDFVLSRDVEVEEKDKDRYGRTVAVLHVGDTTLQDELLAAGLAWFYPRYCRTEECPAWEEKSQAAARARLGLWADLDGPNKPLEPWKWRKRPR